MMDVRARVSAGRIMLGLEAAAGGGSAVGKAIGRGTGVPPGAGVGPEGDAIALVQEDGRTCGATCVLAARLLCEREGAAAARVGALAGATGGLREALHAEQLRLQALMNRHGGGPLGPLPWPRHLGSTAWSVARLMARAVPRGSRGSAGYTVTWVSDGGPSWAEEVERLRGHLADDAPALLVVGGPLVGRGNDGALVGALRRAARRLPPVPRHYVLAVPWALGGREDPGPGRVHVYDPASGAVGLVDLMAARDVQRPGPREFGNWPLVLALIEPS